MKVQVLQENLAKGLSTVGRAVAARSTLPVLGNVLLATDNGRLRISATNLELGMTAWVGAKVSEEGETTVPARTLTDLVNAMRSGPVDLSFNTRSNSLNMRGAGLNNDIKCIDASEFPILPLDDETPGIELNVDDLKEMVDHVVFAAATNDARPILTGVNVKIAGNVLTFAAADGFRLSVRTASLSAEGADDVSAIIPAKALAELGRVLSPDSGSLRMALPPNRGQVIFWLKDVQLVAQLIEGVFPDYQQLIPRDALTRAVVSTQDFLNACKAADIIAREANHTARFKIRPGDDLQPGAIEIVAQHNELGSNEAVVDANISGDELEIAFNVKYMLEVLNVIDTENIELRTNTSTSPGMVQPIGREDFIHVIMPMRLN